MQTLFKKQTVRYYDSDGKQTTATNAKAHNGGLRRGFRRKTEASRKWYGRYVDEFGMRREVALVKDKDASRAKLAELRRKAERIEAGIYDPADDLLSSPIAEQVEAYRKHLLAKENSPKHVRQTINRIKKVMHGCKFALLSDLGAAPVANWLKQGRDSEEFGATTSNYYLGAMKAFANWLVQERRLTSNPISHLRKVNEDTDDERERRALGNEELAWLIKAAQKGDSYRRLGPNDRVIVYLLAVNAGLRANEIATLTPRQFQLDVDPPLVTVKAKYSKRRRTDELPLRADVATKLAAYLQQKDDGTDELIWPGSWSNTAAAMMRRDLAAAREMWLAHFKTDAERDQQSQTDFLMYRDSAGRYADFHALRHTFITNLAEAGVHPRTAQELARHSKIELTMSTYTHPKIAGLTSALEQLPPLPDEVSQPDHQSKATATDIDDDWPAVAQSATGQSGILIHPNSVAPIVAPKTGIEGVSMASLGTEDDADAVDKEMPRPRENSDFTGVFQERRRPDSNRRWRICNPLLRFRKPLHGQRLRRGRKMFALMFALDLGF